MKNSLPSQNQSSRAPRVSLDLLLELLIQFVMILSDPVVKLLPSYSFFSQQESAKCVFVLHGHITAVKSLSFCSSGLALVSGGIGGLLNIWSLQVRKTTRNDTYMLNH